MRLTDLQNLQKLFPCYTHCTLQPVLPALTAVGSTPLQKQKRNQQQQTRAHPFQPHQ